MGVVTVTKNGH